MYRKGSLAYLVAAILPVFGFPPMSSWVVSWLVALHLGRLLDSCDGVFSFPDQLCFGRCSFNGQLLWLWPVVELPD